MSGRSPVDVGAEDMNGSQLPSGVVMITGAGGGVGRAVAYAFGGVGARLLLVDNDSAKLEATFRNCVDGGQDATRVVADITDEEAMRHIIDGAEDGPMRLRCLVNSAGVMDLGDGDASECTDEAWQRTLDINLRAVWVCSRLAIPSMIRAGSGSIINVASVVGWLGSVNAQIAYASSKGGVLALTRELAVRYAKVGIRVNAVCPGIIETPMTVSLVAGDGLRKRLAQIPMGRLASPEDVANAVLWLSSDAASYVTGLHLPVDGGLHAAFLPSDEPSTIT